MIRQLSKSTIMKRYRMFSANRETPGNRLHHRQPGVSYSTIPSFLNLASISSMWMPIFSGSLSNPAHMMRRLSGGQDATMQFVCLILLVLFVFFIRYLASFGPPIVSTSWNLPFRKTFEYDPLSQNSNSPMQNVRC